MTFENDPDRIAPDPRVPVRDSSSSAMSWGIPLALAAFVLIAGLLFFNSDTNRTTTASNDPAVSRQTAPSTPTPAPPATPPAKTQ
jgi:hypothetical protein